MYIIIDIRDTCIIIMIPTIIDLPLLTSHNTFTFDLTEVGKLAYRHQYIALI